MIKWPPSLVKEIAKRRCIFFLGAGVSASAINLKGESVKDWEVFIKDASKLITSSDARRECLSILENGNFLLALQAVVRSIDKSDYHDYLNSNFNNPRFQASRIHEIIFKLDARIVITTNFDKIYDNYCLQQSDIGYKVISYDSQSLVDEIRSDTYLIIKAHGTIDDIHKMVFTKSEYYKAKKEFPNFYEVLKALFITNTVVFIGCGLNDPDVCLLLEDVKIIGEPQKVHYAITKNGQSKFIKEDWKNTYNISALEYGPKHIDLVEELENLLRLVEDERALYCL